MTAGHRRRMGRWTAVWALVLLALPVPGSEAASPPDPWQLAALERYRAERVWLPLRVLGADGAGEARRELRLGPAQEVDLFLPFDADLRLEVRRGDPGSLRLCAGNGSGLCAVATPYLVPGEQRPPLLLWRDDAALPTSEPRIVRLDNLGSREMVLEAASGRFEAPSTRFPEPVAVEGSGPVRTVVAGDTKPRRMFEIGPGSSWSASLLGPAVLRVESRLLYPPGERESRQTYRLEVLLDGRATQTLDHLTGRYPWGDLRVDGVRRLAGRQETSWILVEAGRHDLTLRARRPVLVAVSRGDGVGLFAPGLNGPRIGIENLASHLAPQSAWDGDPADLAGGDVAAAAGAALRLARDNAWEEGGLLAAAGAAALARRAPEVTSLSSLARELRALTTFPRELVPEARPGGLRAWTRSFELVHRAHPGDRGRPLGLDAAGAADLLRELPEASFHEAGVETGSLVYRLPPRAAASELEVVVWEGASSAMEIRVAMEGAGERILRRVGSSSAPILPVLSEAARNVLASDPGRAAWDPEAAAVEPRAARVEVSVARLALPERVRSIELTTSRGQVRVALRYRASRPFALSESAYRSAVTQLGGPSEARHLLEEELAHAGGAGGSVAASEPAVAELTSHWLPTLRRLRSSASVFATLVGGPPPGPGGRPGLGEAATLELAARAENLAMEGQWLPAFELWARAAQGQGPAARRSLRARVDALDRLGEEFLAEALLRSQRIYGGADDGAWAGRRLARRYERSGDASGLRALRAWEAVHRPGEETLSRLVGELLTDGEAEAAAALALLVPSAALSPATRLSAFLEARWWASFDEAVASLPPSGTRELWRARGALVRGEWQTALEAARSAGTSGAGLVGRLVTAEAVWRHLQAGSAGERWRALSAWERWRSAEPGTLRWRVATDRIVAHAGDGSLVNRADGALARYHRATPDQPVILELEGPVWLAVEVRPVHDSAQGSRLDSWLEVRTADGLHLEPILGDRPTAGLEAWSPSRGFPGRSWRREIALGPGRRTVSIRAPDVDLLVRVETLEPAIPLGALPELSPVSMARVLRRDGERRRPSSMLSGSPGVCVLGRRTGAHGAAADDPPCFAARGVRGDESLALPTVPVGAARDDGEATRWALRRGDPIRSDAGGPQLLSDLVTEAGAEERLLLAAHLGLEPSGHALQAVLDEVGETTRYAFLASHDPAVELCGRPLPTSDPGVRSRLDLLLWQVRSGLVAAGAAIVEASDLAARRWGVPGLQGRVARLRRASRWRRIEVAWSLPGVRRLPTPGWQPELPALRVREALLPDAGDARVLGGGITLAALLSSPEPTRVEAAVSQLDLGFLPPRPLSVSWLLDGGDARTVTVAPGAVGERLAWSVPAGEHRLEAWVEQPVADQYARVELEEWQGRRLAAIGDSRERRYWVATRSEPVVLRLHGPAWVRVDEAVNGEPGARIEYRRVADGWQSLELWPRDGQVEGLFRAFVLEPAPPTQAPPPRETPASEIDSPARPGIELAPEGEPAEPQTATVLASGTWTAEATAIRRLLLEDRAGEPNGPEEFIELAARHRRREPEGRWLEGALLGRQRAAGSPTLGALARVLLPPQGLRPSLGLTGSVYVQDLESGPTEFSATLRGSAGRRFQLGRSAFHRPWGGLFVRELSRGSEGPVPSALDQDVFTRYKSDHLRGLTLGESIGVDLAADLRFDASVSVTSNEDLDPTDPDHVAIATGLSALAGPLRLDLTGRLTRYRVDTDRASGVDRSRVELDLAWEHWTRSGRCWELAAGLRHDFDTRDTSGFLGLRWHRGGRRGLVDFAPQDARFEDLRTLRSLRRTEAMETAR